ncbi:DUF2188 domain-containing protein [Microlunatus parietis]|uniref:DUF2188 domain-containing protein n=1 Tax=Microlunatus parietis TaxID=682979 RepID=A0A7Y9I4D9_9ACTN|nr:DUF2188 domain-containing protein [Microlunatus parietis]NYE70061.1 hypothetical protein [Microlunatus parietis]
MVQTEFHVVPRSGHWAIVQDGDVLEAFHSKHLAVEAAMDRAAESQPSKVIVHDADAGVVKRGRGRPATDDAADGAPGART